MKDELLEAILKDILSILHRIEERQKMGLAEIKENAPPVVGSFGSVDPGQ